MDSEDEKQITREEKNKDKLFSFGHRITLRLYEDDEREVKERANRLYLLEREKRNMAGEAMPDDITPSQYDYSSRFRVKRLLRSFIKFHEGSLDLSGRSERRYCSLKYRVIAFVRDVELVERHATRYEIEVEGFPPGTYYTVAYYDVEPAHILADFEAKYRLSEGVGNSLGTIFQDADQCRALLQAETAPILQRRYLTDLPPELIHRIMDVAELEEARLLAATCREFHEISADYIYRTRSLILGDESLRYLFDDDLDADITQYRERFQTEVDFLQSRADIIQRIHSLSIYSCWGVVSLEKVGLEPGSSTHEEFFAPMERGITRALDGTFNLLQLRIGNFGITGSMISAISSLSSLSLLALSKCWLGSDLHSLSRAPQLTQVVNVIFVLEQPVHDDSLHILHVLPNVRNLAIAGAAIGRGWAIPGSVVSFCNPFSTAERVFIFDYADTDEDILMLAAWIANASRDSGQRLPLTQFKLEVQRGIRQHPLMTLLSALRGAPLTALSLIGLSYVGQELFENLASAFPDLGALTLVHRQNDLQRRNGPSVWPGTTWEYAIRLAGFTNLRCFKWNFDIRPVLVDMMCNLPLAERDYEEVESPLLEPTDDLNDWQSLVRLFLVYCPTLEHLVFDLYVIAQRDCVITKDQTGKIAIDVLGNEDIDKQVDPSVFNVLRSL